MQPKNLTINYLTTPMGVYRDIEEYKTVFQELTQALFNTKKKGSYFYLYDGIKIEFSPKYKEEEIVLDLAQSKIILRAPRKKYESSQILSERRMQYLTQLMQSVEAMKTIGITQIYLTLTDEGKEKLKQKKSVIMGKRMK
jgi:hypothetical protein